MRKTASTLAVLAIMTTGLVACNNADNKEGAMDTRYNNPTRVGYYNNDYNRDRGYDRDGNEGPVTDMFDGDNTNNGARNVGYDRSDMNYHGHLNNTNTTNNVNNTNTGYYSREDQRLADKIANRVEKMANVDDARVLVTDNNIVVAVDTNDTNDKNVEGKVANDVKKFANGRNVRVVTDEGTYTRIRNVDNDIRNGVDRTNINDTVRDIMNDLGDAVQRPFKNNR